MMEVVSGDNWSYKMCKAPVNTNKPTSNSLQAGYPSCHPTNNVRALKESFSFTEIENYKDMKN